MLSFLTSYTSSARSWEFTRRNMNEYDICNIPGVPTVNIPGYTSFLKKQWQLFKLIFPFGWYNCTPPGSEGLLLWVVEKMKLLSSYYYYKISRWRGNRREKALSCKDPILLISLFVPVFLFSRMETCWWRANDERVNQEWWAHYFLLRAIVWNYTLSPLNLEHIRAIYYL